MAVTPSPCCGLSSLSVEQKHKRTVNAERIYDISTWCKRHTIAMKVESQAFSLKKKAIRI